MGDVLVAKESFSTTINDTPRVVTKGETFRVGHPVTKGREELFEDFKVDNDVEQATAAPGEKRRGGAKANSTESTDSTKQAKATAAPGEKRRGGAKANSTESTDSTKQAKATAAPGEKRREQKQASE